MTKVFPLASRGLVLAALSLLLTINPEGNAQGDPSDRRADASETAKTVARLAAALKDRAYWPDQYRAAEGLEKLGPLAEDALPDLIAALKDPEPFVRMAAARALAKIGSSSPEVLAALRAAAKDEKKHVRDGATEAYQTLCDALVDKARKEDVPALIVSLKDPDPSLRIAAARALARVGSISPDVLAALRVAAKDEEKKVRDAAITACEGLVTKAPRDDVLALIVALKDPEPFIRRAVVRRLGKVSFPSASPEALAALKAASKDEDPEVSRAASKAWERLPTLLTLKSAGLLELKRGTRTSFRLQVQRQKLEGAVLVKCEGAPKDVVIPEVTIPADKSETLIEVGIGDLAPGTRQEARILGTVSGVVGESRVVLYLAHEPPLVEAYLQRGKLSEGDAALSKRLKDVPGDDQARFGLGVLRFVRGVERLGQSLHKYGARSDNTNLPFLRLPVPRNLDPTPINYAAFRRFLADFHRDLSEAEAILAGVTNDKVKLPLHLSTIRLDLVGNGKASDKFIDVLKKIMHLQELNFLEANPDFLVCFDRGDVAWLRAYCHLLMGMLDFFLAFDTEQSFDLSADDWFVKPEIRFRGSAAERRQKLQDAIKVVAVKEPVRLGEFRKHLIKVAELNRETWKHIRARRTMTRSGCPTPGKRAFSVCRSMMR